MPDESQEHGGTALPLSAFTPASAESVLEWDDREGLRVRTPSQQWAYAAIAPLVVPPSEQATLVSVRARVLAGKVGFGVLDADGKMLAEKGLNGGSDEQIALEIPSSEASSRFVVRNWSGDGVPSQAVVRSVALRQAGVRGRPGTRRIHQRPGIAREWFLRYLRRSIAVLEDERASDWEKIDSVREWAYQKIPRADKYTLIDPIDDLGPEEMFLAFDDFLGGLACGGTAQLLARLYDYLGYRSYIYNMGTPAGGLSHVSTVVDIEHDGERVLSLQDAYFNFTLTRSDGAPADLRAVIRLLEAGERSSIVVRNGKATGKLVSARADNFEHGRLYLRQHYRLGPPIVRNGGVLYSHDFSLDTFERLGEFTSWIAGRVGRHDFVYLVLFPLGTSGEAEIEAVAREAERVQRRLALA